MPLTEAEIEDFLTRRMSTLQEEVRTNTHPKPVFFVVGKLKESVEEWLNEIFQAIETKTYIPSDEAELPHEIRKLTQEAAKNIFIENYGAALICCEAIVEKAINENWEAAQYQLGKIYFSLNQLENAKKHYISLAEKTSDAYIKDKAHFGLSQIFIKTGKAFEAKNSLDEALSEYKQAADFSKAYQEFFEMKEKEINKRKNIREGKTAFKEKNYEVAINCYTKILDTHPKEDDVRLQRIRAIRLNNIPTANYISQAFSDCEILIKNINSNTSPSRSCEIFHEKGLLKLWESQHNSEAIDYQTGKVDVSENGWAIRYFEQSLEYNPQSWKAYLEMGMARKLSGKKLKFLTENLESLNLKEMNDYVESSKKSMGILYSKACEHFTRAFEINPNCFEAHWEMAEIFEELGRYEEAKKHYEIVSQSAFVQSQAARVKKANMEEALGNYQAAIKDYDMITQDSAFNFGLYSETKIFLNAAKCAQEISEPNRALQYYLLALHTCHQEIPLDMIEDELAIMKSNETDVSKYLTLIDKLRPQFILIKTAESFYMFSFKDNEWRLINIGNISHLLNNRGINFDKNGTPMAIKGYPELYQHFLSFNPQAFKSNITGVLQCLNLFLAQNPAFDLKQFMANHSQNEHLVRTYIHSINYELSHGNYDRAIQLFTAIDTQIFTQEDEGFLLRLADASLKRKQKNIDQSYQLYKLAQKYSPDNSITQKKLENLENLKMMRADIDGQALRKQGLFNASVSILTSSKEVGSLGHDVTRRQSFL